MKVVWVDMARKGGGSPVTPTTGLIEIRSPQTSGALALAMPGGEGRCRGAYDYDRETGKGRWSADCGSGVSASGNFLAVGPADWPTGQGKDSTGRLVTFVIATAAHAYAKLVGAPEQPEDHAAEET